MWYLYLLWNPRIKRTYIGCTTDPKRRLRQHNREIKGGAKSTAKGAPDWTLYCYIEGFTTRSQVMRWERIAKHNSHGLLGRSWEFKFIILGVGNKKGNKYKVPTGLKEYWLPGSIDPTT
jgi:predicted GIY-YIG superfamily endonuclease